jgi:hypothetical protein
MSSYGTLVTIYQTTRCHNQEDQSLNLHLRINLKSSLFFFLCDQGINIHANKFICELLLPSQIMFYGHFHTQIAFISLFGKGPWKGDRLAERPLPANGRKTNSRHHNTWDTISRTASQEILLIYEARRLITVFTKAHHWTSFRVKTNTVNIITSYFLKINFNIVTCTL